MRLTLLIFSVFLGLNIFGQTQVEINMSSCEKFQEKDKELNLVYSYIIELYSIDTVFIEKLCLTQNNWIKLRDSDLATYMLEEEYYGSFATSCRCSFLTELTEQRIDFLNKWANGNYEEGWVCGGTTRMIGYTDEEYKSQLKFRVKYERD
jgi:uncharacterized protein YecT (DUF1311 family)